MATVDDIGERLATLEYEVAELKRRVQQSSEKVERWPDGLVGRMKEFSEWPDICREGKEVGNAQGDYVPPS